MLSNNGHPRTLLQAVRYFANPDVAEGYIEAIKWPDGPYCPSCGNHNVGRIMSRRLYQCRSKNCRKQFTVKVGTIMQDSPLPVDHWLIAGWMLVNCRNGVSSCEIARTLGIKQTSAWHLLHRLREVITPTFGRRFCGTVEADETFIGGKFENMSSKRRDRARKRPGPHGKTVVQAMLERKQVSEVRAMVVPGVQVDHIRNNIRSHVEPDSRLYTDSGKVYRWARYSSDYIHRTVNHSYEYVRGRVHVNGLENFFSLFARTIGGTYIAVNPKHLEAYANEQVYRFNNRKEGDWQRFDRAMHRIVGKRLTYKELTGGKRR